MRAARTDANHAEVVKALRAIGASVADTSRVGGGFPDLVCGFRGRNWMLEVKDGRKPPSKRQLTTEQELFVQRWRGHWACVTSADEAVRLVSRSSGQQPELNDGAEKRIQAVGTEAETAAVPVLRYEA